MRKLISLTKISLFILMALATSQADARITTRKVADKKKAPPAEYDGSRNFLGEDVYQYKGQELYLMPKSKKLREFGYDGFIRDYRKGTYNKSNKYKCCSGFGSKYDSLAGKYFTVLDVIRHPKADDYPYNNKSYLKLKEQESGDILYYEYDSQFEHAFPFIVVKFFEREKKLLLGKGYIVKGRNWWDSGPMTDINTGKPVDFACGSLWQCVDLTIEERFCSLALILENNKGEQIALSYDRKDNTYYVFERDDAERYRKVFGDRIWGLILAEKVQLGMTKEMCRLSWGDPTKINSTKASYGVHEQWVYSDQYLYFEQGKLTAIQ